MRSHLADSSNQAEHVQQNEEERSHKIYIAWISSERLKERKIIGILQ